MTSLYARSRTLFLLLALLLFTSPLAHGQAGQDKLATGSLVAAQDTVRLHLTAVGAVAFQLTGTFSATVTFEASVDATNYVAVSATNANTGAKASTTTTTGIYLVHCPGAQYIRARCSAYTSGTAVVTANASTATLQDSAFSTVSSGSADTELPAAAGLADATANPTAPATGSFIHGYNGTTWDRLRTANGAQAGAVASTPVLGSTNLLNDASTLWQIPRTASAVLDGVAGGAMGTVAPWIWNGSTFDRVRSASGDGLAATGLMGSGNMVWNGTTWDRAKGTTSVVGLTRVAAGVAVAAGDGFSNNLAGIQDETGGGRLIGAALFASNGTSHDRIRNNIDVTLLASGTRSTTQTSADITTYNLKGIYVILDMTVVGTGSVTVTINGKDPASGKYYLLLSGAAVITNVTNVYKVYPGLTAAANAAANDHLPRTIQIVVTHNNGNNAIYSVGYSLLN